jgi:hypothetical protein
METELLMPLPDFTMSSNECFSIINEDRHRLDDPLLPLTVTSSPIHSLRLSSPDYIINNDNNIVVCGRGKGAYNRPGNQRFRRLIRTYLPSYLQATSKLQKSRILQEIFDATTASDLVFVKPQSPTGGWLSISDKERRDKIGHAMREAVAEQQRRTTTTTTTNARTDCGKRTTPHRYVDNSNCQEDRKEYIHNSHLIPSDITVSTTESSHDDSNVSDQELDDRRSRVDRLLESFRSQQQQQSVVSAVASRPVQAPQQKQGEWHVEPGRDRLLDTNIAFYAV